jgi:hypothetical protein
MGHFHHRQEEVMASSTLMSHCGGRDVTLNELATIEAPPPTETWFPVAHFDVFRAAQQTLTSAGYTIGKQRFAISHQGHRFFGVLDLENRILDGVSLAVGIRNSTDKSFPIGFCCGQRVFVCDNLAFTSEIVVAKKHTKFGQDRYQEGIACAVQQLSQYQQAQADWIGGLQARHLAREEADSLILRSYEENLIGARELPQVIKEWRTPQFDEFRDATAWSLWNAFTTVLGRTKQTRPADAAITTIKLQRLFTPEVIDGEVIQATETQLAAAV